MNRRLIGVFAFALAVAGFTSFIVYKLLLAHVGGPSQTAKSAAPQEKIFVAAHDLPIGTLIKDADVAERLWPGVVPKQAVRVKSDLIGRGVISPVYENEYFSDQRLAPKGAGAGLAATIPVGMRALALRVNDVVILGGFVQPGMHVDVLVTGDVPGDTSNAGRRCKTVLQNVQVLSVGQHIEKNPEGKPEMAEIVNVLLTPDQAETLDLASGEARVQLVLRNPVDLQEQATKGASMASLFGLKPGQLAAAAPPQPAPPQPHAAPAPAAAPPAPPQPTVEVFSGGHKSGQMIEIPGGAK